MDELRDRVEALEAERQAVIDVVNLYGDEVLHAQKAEAGFEWATGKASLGRV